jgi:hypothetical protein
MAERKKWDELKSLLMAEDRDDVIESLNTFINDYPVIFYLVSRVTEAGKIKTVTVVTPVRCVFINCASEKGILRTHIFFTHDLKSVDCSSHKVEGRIRYNIKLSFSVGDLNIEHTGEEEAKEFIREISKLVPE